MFRCYITKKPVSPEEWEEVKTTMYTEDMGRGMTLEDVVVEHYSLVAIKDGEDDMFDEDGWPVISKEAVESARRFELGGK